MAQDNDAISSKLAIQRLEMHQENGTKALNEMSASLSELVAMQKKHEIFHAEVRGELTAEKLETARAHMRITKIETIHTWFVRLVLAAITVQALSLIYA